MLKNDCCCVLPTIIKLVDHGWYWVPDGRQWVSKYLGVKYDTKYQHLNYIYPFRALLPLSFYNFKDSKYYYRLWLGRS